MNLETHKNVAVEAETLQIKLSLLAMGFLVLLAFHKPTNVVLNQRVEVQIEAVLGFPEVKTVITAVVFAAGPHWPYRH